MTTDFLRQVREAGVVGAGGAGFPTHVKLKAQVEYVLVNGAECEPLLRADQNLLAKYSRELWGALCTVLNHTGSSKAIIALKKKYEPAIRALTRCKPRDPRLNIHYLPDFYPAGDEHILVHEVTGRIVPEGGIPLQVGCVVLNVETLYNLFRALEGCPVTHKFVTVTGAVHKPLTVSVPLGTKYSELVQLADGATVKEYSMIGGGPMMGFLADSTEVVSKTTGGIIVLPPDHPLVRYKNSSLRSIVLRARAVCCQCRACTDLCPRYLQGHNLEPHKTMRALGSGSIKEYLTNAYLCSECGVCDRFACPMDLAPRQINKLFKEEMTKLGIQNPHQKMPTGVRPCRENRKVPSWRLVMRLGLGDYDLPAPLTETRYVPGQVRLPLRQHLGQAAVPVVKPGDYVETGQLLAEIPEGSALSARIHASINGTVLAIEDGILIKNE